MAVPVTPPELIGRLSEGGMRPPVMNTVASWSFSSASETWTSMSYPEVRSSAMAAEPFLLGPQSKSSLWPSLRPVPI